MLRTTTYRDPETGVISVALIGDLALGTHVAARDAVSKAAAECPPAVLVDLSAMHSTDSAQLSLFPAITYQAQNTWGVPVLLCGADGHVRRELAAFRTFVALYEDAAQALVAVRAHVPRWIRHHLAPVPASAAAVRDVIDETCATWGLTRLRDTARLVASELAANAIVHAATGFDLLASYTGRFLRIAVQDGSPELPRIKPQAPVRSAIIPPGSGRGLRIIAAVATHWGVTRTAGGKIVWVLIRTSDR